MSFQLGQRVKHIGEHPKYRGREGFITRNDGTHGCPYRDDHLVFHIFGTLRCDVSVLFDGDSQSVCTHEHDLVPLDPPKEFQMLREREKEPA